MPATGRRPRMTAALALCALTVSALALTACTADADADASTSPSASASRTATPNASPSSTASASPTPDADAAACLVGDWRSEQADLGAYYATVNETMQGSGATFTPAGSAGLALRADGTFSWTPDVEITAEVSGTQILVTMQGSIDGNYTVSGDRIATQNESTANLQISATIDGAPTDAGTLGEQIGGAPLTDSSFTCSSDTLILTGTLADQPITTTLHR